MAKRVQHALMRRDDETTTKVSKSIVLSAWLYLSHITLHLAMTVISETNMRMLFLMRSTLTENLSQARVKEVQRVVSGFLFISPRTKEKKAKQKTSGMLFHSIPLCLWRLSLHYPRPNGYSPFPLVSMAVGRLFHSARRHTARFVRTVRTGASIVTNKSRQILLSLTMWLRHTLRHVVPYLLAYAICMCEIPCERVRAFDAIIMR